MTDNTKKTGEEPTSAETSMPQQQVADESSVDSDESFANIEQDSVQSSADITPGHE